MNTELFKKIHEVFETIPDRVDMSAWESDCGTTRCLAGWAIHLTTDAPVYESRGSYELSDETLNVARSLGSRRQIDRIAADLLRLDRASEAVFYEDFDKASQFVQLAATGREVEAKTLLEDS